DAVGRVGAAQTGDADIGDGGPDDRRARHAGGDIDIDRRGPVGGDVHAVTGVDAVDIGDAHAFQIEALAGGPVAGDLHLVAGVAVDHAAGGSRGGVDRTGVVDVDRLNRGVVGDEVHAVAAVARDNVAAEGRGDR